MNTLYTLSLNTICHKLFEEYEDLFYEISKNEQEKHSGGRNFTYVLFYSKGYAMKVRETIKSFDLPEKLQVDIFDKFENHLGGFELFIELMATNDSKLCSRVDKCKHISFDLFFWEIKEFMRDDIRGYLYFCNCDHFYDSRGYEDYEELCWEIFDDFNERTGFARELVDDI